MSFHLLSFRHRTHNSPHYRFPSPNTNTITNPSRIIFNHYHNTYMPSSNRQQRGEIAFHLPHLHSTFSTPQTITNQSLSNLIHIHNQTNTTQEQGNSITVPHKVHNTIQHKIHSKITSSITVLKKNSTQEELVVCNSSRRSGRRKKPHAGGIHSSGEEEMKTLTRLEEE